MTAITVKEARVDRDFTTDAGIALRQMKVDAQDGRTYEWTTKPDRDPPQPGTTLEGETWEDPKWGWKFKLTPRPGPGSFRPRDPAETRSIVRQHSQHMAILWAQMAHAEGREFTLADLKDVIDWFDADAAQAATPPPPAEKTITGEQKKKLAKALRASHTTTAPQIKAAALKIVGREIGPVELEQLTSREATAFITGLEVGALPDPEHPSDIPDDQEQFEVPTGAVGTDPSGDPF